MKKFLSFILVFLLFIVSFLFQFSNALGGETEKSASDYRDIFLKYTEQYADTLSPQEAFAAAYIGDWIGTHGLEHRKERSPLATAIESMQSEADLKKLINGGFFGDTVSEENNQTVLAKAKKLLQYMTDKEPVHFAMRFQSEPMRSVLVMFDTEDLGEVGIYLQNESNITLLAMESPHDRVKPLGEPQAFTDKDAIQQALAIAKPMLSDMGYTMDEEKEATAFVYEQAARKLLDVRIPYTLEDKSGKTARLVFDKESMKVLFAYWDVEQSEMYFESEYGLH